MLFNSLEFLLFFPAVLIFYFALPYKLRWVVLLAASYVFYMCWKVEYILLIVVSTIVDYYVAQWVHQAKDQKSKLRFLMLSVFTNLGILFSFKYFNFVNENIRELFGWAQVSYDMPALEVLLPVGISFYTFQTLGYTLDVYRGRIEPEKHFGRFALYVSFFPQLVAGPIERASNLLPQFKREYSFDYKRITDGFKLMLWGFFKKIVIADRLAAYVDMVYNHPNDHEGLTYIVGTVFFAVQIFCDFSGYTDIAIGAAQVMGFTLMNNFNRPYFSKSISEFWKRWHISLSSWFKDYLYIPLGGNRVVKWRWYYNLFITFLISGLWHGANWTFVVWGALHGGYLVLAIWTESFRNTINQAIGILKFPFLLKLTQVLFVYILVCAAWIFFRANNVTEGFQILMGSFRISPHQIYDVILPGITKYEFFLSIGLILFMEFIHLLQRKGSLRAQIALLPKWQRWSVYYGVVLAIIFLGKFDQQAFIYFQF